MPLLIVNRFALSNLQTLFLHYLFDAWPLTLLILGKYFFKFANI